MVIAMALTELEREMATALMQCQKFMLMVGKKWDKSKIKFSSEELHLSSEVSKIVTTILVKSSQVAIGRERFIDPKTEPPSYLLNLVGYRNLWPDKMQENKTGKVGIVRILLPPFYHSIRGCWVFKCETFEGTKIVVPIGDIDPTPLTI